MIITSSLSYVKYSKRAEAPGRVDRGVDQKDHPGKSRRREKSKTVQLFLYIFNVETLQTDPSGLFNSLRIRGDERDQQLQQVVIITILNSRILLNTPNRFFEGKMD